MNKLLWVVQGLLAFTFAVSGCVKAGGSREWLVSTGQTGVAAFPTAFIRFIATCEVLGAVGVVVPWYTGIAPFLTPVAAGGLAVIMVGAANTHSALVRQHWGDLPRRRRELRNVGTNITLFALCVAVVVGRGGS